MKCKKIVTMTTVMAMAIGSFFLSSSTNVEAAKKLSVNKVYTTTTKVKGKTKGKYRIRIKIGKKTYKAIASKKGNFTVKIPKQKKGKTFYVKAYKKKGKKLKYYTKKKVIVKKKAGSSSSTSVRYTGTDGKPYTGKIPGLKDEINLEETLRLYELSGDKYIDYDIYDSKNENLTYRNNRRRAFNFMQKGYLYYYSDVLGYGTHMHIQSLHGITLYYTFAPYGGEAKTPSPTQYDGIVKPNERIDIKNTDVPGYDRKNKGSMLDKFRIKIHGYLNGKLIMIDYEKPYMF